MVVPFYFCCDHVGLHSFSIENAHLSGLVVVQLAVTLRDLSNDLVYCNEMVL